MKLIKWSKKFSVGVKIVDNQHKKLFALINALYTAIQEDREEKEVKKTINELNKYVVYHFGTEEKYFKKFGYRESKEHVERHKYYINKIKKFEKDYKQGNIMLSLEILDFMQDWIFTHIAVVDRNYTEFFNEHGLK